MRLPELLWWYAINVSRDSEGVLTIKDIRLVVRVLHCSKMMILVAIPRDGGDKWKENNKLYCNILCTDKGTY